VKTQEHNGHLYYLVDVYDHGRAGEDPAWGHKMTVAERFVKDQHKNGWMLWSWDGNGFYTTAVIPSLEEAITFKLTHL